nr:hypothetical protein [Clostridium gasigenes]
MESDLLNVIEAAMNEELANIEVKWNKRDMHKCSYRIKRIPSSIYKRK